MRIVGKRVQENIRQLQAGHVVIESHTACENQTIRIDAPGLRFSPQIGPRRIPTVPQPKDTFRNFAQELHPDFKQGGRDFPILVEATEYHAFFG